MTRRGLHFEDRTSRSLSLPVPGDTIPSSRNGDGSYELSEILADRPAATVFGGFKSGLGLQIPVAVKVLKTQDPVVADALRSSVQAFSRFGGPHVVRVFDVGVLPSMHPFLVMDRLTGVPLGQFLVERGALPLSIAADAMVQVCQALIEPHASNVIHGDIKPTSLLLSARKDGSVHVSLLGFDRPCRCTPGYASPEQLGTRADIDARTDIWALGILLFEMVTGRRAYPVDTLDAMRLRALIGPLPPMASPHGRIPEAFELIVRRATMIHRTGRFSTVAELKSALAPFAALPRPKLLLRGRTPNTNFSSSADPTLVRGSAEGAVRSGVSEQTETVTRATLVPPALHAPALAETTSYDADPYAKANVADEIDSSRTIARRSPPVASVRRSAPGENREKRRPPSHPGNDAPARVAAPYTESDPDGATNKEIPTTPPPPLSPAPLSRSIGAVASGSPSAPERRPRDTMTSVPRQPRLKPTTPMAMPIATPIGGTRSVPTAVPGAPIVMLGSPRPSDSIQVETVSMAPMIRPPPPRPSYSPPPRVGYATPRGSDEVTRISTLLPPSVHVPAPGVSGRRLSEIDFHRPTPAVFGMSTTPPPAPPSDAPATLDAPATHRRRAKPSSPLRVFIPLGLALGLLCGTLWVSRHRITHLATSAHAAGPPATTELGPPAQGRPQPGASAPVPLRVVAISPTPSAAPATSAPAILTASATTRPKTR